MQGVRTAGAALCFGEFGGGDEDAAKNNDSAFYLIGAQNEYVPWECRASALR